MLSPYSCTQLPKRQPVLSVLIVAPHLSCVPQMEAVQRAGLARHIGVSNFRVADLQLLLKTAKVKVRAPVQLVLCGRHGRAAPAEVEPSNIHTQAWLPHRATGLWTEPSSHGPDMGAGR